MRHFIFIFFLGCTVWGIPTTNAAKLVPVTQTQFYVEPETDQVLSFKWEGDTVPTELAYEISDYSEKKVSSASIKTGGLPALQIPLHLKQGYYEITFPTIKTKFGLSVLPAFSKKPDLFFGMDVAMSWLYFPQEEDLRMQRLQILKRSGIFIARERLSWKEMNPKEGEWIWLPQYKLTRESYQKSGVKILDVFHDAPLWLDGLTRKYPKNLLKTFTTWKQFLPQLGAGWGGLELWNEPDISFGGDLPADQYVPLVKVWSEAARQSGATVPLIGGVFTDRAPDNFLEACAQNGLYEHIQGISFHAYKNVEVLEERVSDYRRLLEKYGAAQLPIWITESGKESPIGDYPTRPNFLPDAMTALDLAMKAVESKACGIQSFFPFVFAVYVEFGQIYSVVGEHFSPLRGMADYNQAINVLSGKAYIGDLKLADHSVLRARIFADKAETVMVIYTGKVQAGKKVPLDFEVLRAEGIDGRSLALESARILPVEDGLTYAWVDPAKLKDSLETNTLAMKLWKQSKETKIPTLPTKSLVLQTQVELEQFDQIASAGYYLNVETAQSVQLGVNVLNLSDKEMNLNLKAVPPQGTRFIQGENMTKLKLPAKSSQMVSWKLDFSTALKNDRIDSFIVEVGEESSKSRDKLVMNFGLVPKKPKLAMGFRRTSLASDAPITAESWESYPPIVASQAVVFGGGKAAKVSDVQDKPLKPKGFAPKDLAVKARFAWNEDGLFFLFEVTDDVHYSIPNMSAWQADSVQMAFHPEGLRTGAGYNDKDREILMCLHEGKPEIYLTHPSPSTKPFSNKTFLKAERRKDKETPATFYQGLLAWEDLGMTKPEQGTKFGLNFIVNDNDGLKRKGWLEWTSGIGGSKDTQAFAEVTLISGLGQ
jgi:hypothetical protein